MRDQKILDSREIAKRLGTLSIEERVQIIKSLLEAGPDGQQLVDIAVNTGLGAPAINKQIEALLGAEMVIFKSVENNKVYYANTSLLNELFSHMLFQYGPGPQESADPVDSDSEE